ADEKPAKPKATKTAKKEGVTETEETADEKPAKSKATKTAKKEDVAETGNTALTE
ncbi:MAG: hypothetical protein GX800_02085, partial [Clostridiaceae bacterium]|nr:hypothetical protein [Clostridiaceae bacterium]